MHNGLQHNNWEIPNAVGRGGYVFEEEDSRAVVDLISCPSLSAFSLIKMLHGQMIRLLLQQ